MGKYDLSKLNVLSVDGNKHARNLVKQVLYALGVKNIVESSNGEEAFEELGIFPIDLVLCDWKMRPMDGIEFTRKVRTSKNSPNPLVPIIMVTGYTDVKRVTEARDAGVNEFLVKPFSPQGLYIRICTIIEHPRTFITEAGFSGPSRRRHLDAYPNEADRRSNEEEEEGEIVILDCS